MREYHAVRWDFFRVATRRSEDWTSRNRTSSEKIKGPSYSRLQAGAKIRVNLTEWIGMLERHGHDKLRLTECPICETDLRGKRVSIHIGSHDPDEIGLSPTGVLK